MLAQYMLLPGVCLFVTSRKLGVSVDRAGFRHQGYRRLIPQYVALKRNLYYPQK